MKKIILSLISITFSLMLQSQGIIGAWEGSSTSKNGELLKTVVIFSNGYQVATTYDATTGKFINSNGGKWKLEGNMMTEEIEFHTDNPDLVGAQVSFKVRITNDEIEIIDRNSKLKRLDNGSPGKLQGAWLMSGRIRDGKTQLRDTSKPRKTMKILSGTRFQWIAYNTETKQFMGTGGGTYTTKNGKYTENIEFFSKDDSKTGRSLKFDYELIDGTWHHSGLSSKGSPIHEIWSIRE
ncbi:membrane or secreted protein [Polaribacter litorisediminis]|uniref:membrane or secreted protein n=1 Tax=Polaribacter litorisediminis TaxID=1908341 RepID=UPI001CBF2FE6|nr:membrane or secreted protein [Polaribacter litorisediminis]UAM99482.1 membrane or secreted protein [Polaribacter litorisediminis]